MDQHDYNSAVLRLNTYCFETIWNGAPGEYTTNIALTQVGQRAVVGVVVLGGKAYSLPDSNLYSVFTLNYTAFGNSELLPSGQWLMVDTILAQKQTLLSIYNDGGLNFPRNMIYLYRDRIHQLVLVAIRNDICLKLFPFGLPPLYITSYRNPTPTVAIQSWSFRLPTPLTTVAVSALQTRISTCLAQSVAGTIMTINGYDVDPTNTHTWAADDCIDILLDTSVIAAYEVDVGTLNTGYLSTIYSETRDLLHCPKSDNPNMWLLTHESSYISIWDANLRRGVHVPRLSTHCVEQVTHADWSISRSVVTALQAAISAETIIARVRVRCPAKPNVLAPTASFLTSLYECNDTEICEYLLGNIDSAVTFWMAANMEQNPYVTLLFQTPNGTDAEILSTYRNALGYDQTIAILGETTQANLPAEQTLIITKPYCLQNKSCYAMVYYNGRKLADSQVTQLNLSQGRHTFGINPALYIDSTNTFSISIIENAPFYAKTIYNATAGVLTTTHSPYVSVYKYIPFASPIVGWDGTDIGGGYVKLASGIDTYSVIPAFTGSGYTVTGFSPLDSSTLLVVDDIYVAVVTIALDTILTSGAPLIFQLTQTDTSGTVIPLLNFGTLDVYINGYKLALTLDYNLLYWTDPNTDAIGRIDLVVANKTYLNLTCTGNTLEIIAHSSVTTSSDVSYVLGQTLRHQVSPSFWNTQLSRCFVEGVLDKNVAWHTNWITTSGQPEGGVGCWDTMIHRRLYELMCDNDATSDYTNLGIIETTLNHITPTPPSVVIQTSQHTLYSPYLTAIITDVVNGNLTLVDDPDPRMFLQQFDKYSSLKAVDPCLSTYAGPINTTYVAITVSYINITISSSTTEALVQRLISYVIDPTLITLGETLV